MINVKDFQSYIKYKALELLSQEKYDYFRRKIKWIHVYERIINRWKEMLYKKRLIDLREELNLKQYEIARQLNISPTTYNNYENEYEICPIKHLNNLCIYFNVSMDYLFSIAKIRTYKDARKNINKEILKKRIKDLRIKNNLTQKELANILNVDSSTISKYEHGINIKYNISADYLLGKIYHPKYLK